MMTGGTLKERYSIHEQVGSGEMADVYRATDNLLGRTVAVKILHQQYAEDQAYMELFRRQAKAAAGVSQRNVSIITDWGVEKDGCYVVEEYLEGTGLDGLLAREAPLPFERAVEIAISICLALEAAHARGIVHRDIKPQNVIVTRDNQVKVMDFGIARAAGGSAMTQTGTIMGTAQYISPEQAQGRSADPRSDLYSLGVVIYEMLTGKVPFEGETPVAIAYKHVREDPLPPSMINPDISPELESVVMKALAKNPENRYQTALEMQADLERCLEGAPVHATPVLPPEETRGATRAYPAVASPPPARRSRAWIWVVVAVLLLAGAGAGVWALLRTTTGIQVPDLTGKTEEEAAALLEEIELELGEVTRDFNPTVPEGEVVSQNPRPGTSASTGMKVDVVISKGAAQVSVPDCSGLTPAEAEAVIKGAGLEVGTTEEEFSRDIPAGKVSSQEPAPGQQVAAGSSVNLVVSKGPETVSVPDVVGLGSEQAQARISENGLVAEVRTVTTTAHPEGSVFEQSPAAGESAAKGSSVTINVATRPAQKQVPDVVGMQRAAAENALDAEGFRVRVIEQVTPDASKVGTVIRQSPSAGATVIEGELVTIYVGVSSS